MSDEPHNPPEADDIKFDASLQEVEGEEAEALPAGATEAQNRKLGGNGYLRSMMDTNFIEYASYVIKERAIPDVDDGLKPVQRRILWALSRLDDGKFHKVANVIGHTMQFHPHGDASIGDALVVLANKEYFIERQGNFGNIFTGDGASAPRYIECRLTPMGREVLFNNDITEFVDSYDGRNREPVVLPVKIPSLLMLGSDGIAVGMATRILPHNFNEVIQAQIALLQGEEFELYPDFQQGGLMDVREYERGNGKIILRARIDIEGRKLLIREIPATTTTEKLIASIEKAAEKNKIKIASISDFTGEKVEIEVIPTRGYDPEKALRALYTYTDCSVSISVNMMVICENRPVQMNTRSVIERNTARLLEYLKRELEIELAKLEEQFHAKTLAQIFIENRLYKRIEECDSTEAVMAEVHAGLAPFRHFLKRDVTDEDVERLLAIQIRRISLFDIRKNQQDLQDILSRIDEIQRHLKRLKAYAIKYLEALLAKYGPMFPRRTEIEYFEKIDRRDAALNNIKVGWDRKNGYIGTAVRSVNPDDTVTCNEFDVLLCIERNGSYRIISIPEKLFIGKLYAFRKYDPSTEFGIIYRENTNGKFYGKRSVINKFIKDKEYQLCPEKCRLELLTPRTDAWYELVETKRLMPKTSELNLLTLPLRAPKARGIRIGGEITKITFNRYLAEEELLQFRTPDAIPATEADSPEEPESEPAGGTTVPPPAPTEAPDAPDETSKPDGDGDMFGSIQPEFGF
ncbi:DNA topoisomerase IV subunit A [Victivallis sp. Marseille-Q1083]|uniref:DNA topoisomerase IV subunit A n=1 Tax=Victivallis sp. Marseille-Q1083 TaxID=2717288 RepID=UPI00158F228E|nr:DNA topoisomerase IV subunit A [Victivallis sp. Marseille-Q1083]